MKRYRANLPAISLHWADQSIQYKDVKPAGPGITHFKGQQEGVENWVDCLLMYDENLELIGILNYFAWDFPPWEVAGNITMFTHPDKYRRGIGSDLLDEARRRWTINFDQQDYTVSGAAFINRYIQQRSLQDGISRVAGS